MDFLPIPLPTDSKAYEKAIDVFGKILQIAPNAIARLYKDWVQPNAEARKIRLIGQANVDVVFLKSTVQEQIEARASKRNKLIEIERQENIEEIVHLASKYISEQVNEKAVEEDWIKRFSNIAQDVSKRELKSLWAKILAGEIANPGTFSFRTLDLLKNISAEEAMVFIEYCKLADSEGCLFVGGESIHHANYDFQYFHILMLQEAGLILAGGQGGVLTLEIELEASKDYAIHFGKSEIRLRSKEPFGYSVQYYKVSRSGQEVATLIEDPKNLEFIRKLVEWFNGDNRISAALIQNNQQ